MAWGIGEWYGVSVASMTPDERREAAERAIAETGGGGAAEVGERELCPFIQHSDPGALCNKGGGVCSIAPYEGGEIGAPAAVCPRRLLAMDESGRDVFDLLARECLDVEENGQYAVIREVPFLEKINSKGEARGTKAGRIDWVLVGNSADGQSDWLAVETQAVYFSGSAMAEDFHLYRDDPSQLQVTAGNRRPDWRSSGAKRLAPQLEVKSPVMNRWGKKIAVVIDQGFYNEFSGFQHGDVDFDNSEVIWVVMSYDESMNSRIKIERFAELEDSLKAIQATRPMNRSKFEAALEAELAKGSSKVSFKGESE